MKSMKLVLAGAVLALGLTAQAEAKFTDFGNLSGGATESFSDVLANGASLSSDSFQFELSPGGSDLRGIIGSLFVNSFAATITGPSSFSHALTPFYNFDNLSAGTYTVSFSGTVKDPALLGKVGGGFGTLFSVSAVPEADTWMMLLIGAGLVAFQLRRKQKTLRHRPLTAA